MNARQSSVSGIFEVNIDPRRAREEKMDSRRFPTSSSYLLTFPRPTRRPSSFFLLTSDFQCRRHLSSCAQINLVFASSQRNIVKSTAQPAKRLLRVYSPRRVVGESFRSLDATPFFRITPFPSPGPSTTSCWRYFASTRYENVTLRYSQVKQNSWSSGLARTARH